MSTEPKNWRQKVDLVYAAGILAEDDRGDLWVPMRARVGLCWVDGRRHIALIPGDPTYWDRRFRWWKPAHWPYWLRARITKQLACIETVP